MEINGDPPPLIWPQFETTDYNRRRSSIFGPTMIAAISAVILLLFVIFVVPPFLSITSQILQPASVKKGWDSINVVLVVFAILCGVLARRNDDGLYSPSLSHGGEEEEIAVVAEDIKVSSSSEVSERWFDDVYDVDRLKIYESLNSRSFSSGLPVTGTLPLRRSSSSYPDLRNGVLRETVDRRSRFYDDFEIDKYRSQSTVNDSRCIYEQTPNRSKIEIEESEIKEIPVDKFVVTPPQQPSTPPSTPPPPPPPAVEVSHKPRKSHRSVRNRDIIQEKSKRSDDSTKFKRAFHPPPSPPPPPPPPPLITATPPRKLGTLQRRKSNAAKEIKMVFASLYNQGKKKKKITKPKRKERIESPVTEPPQYQSSFPPPSPPPPPPPPPPLRSSQSVFYGLFKKGVKSKKIHSVPAPPPPPPPPPRNNIQSESQTPPRRSKSGRPPRPIKPTNLNEDNYQGSPLIQITPPPPPPPPFKVPPLKFVVSGDFAKIRSNQSSRCSSPEREVIDIGWGLELTQSEEGVETTDVSGGKGGGGRPGFCPSPDVNTKADNFIARLRDEWRLDKINSVQGGKRNLGSLQGPISGPL
ncbi:hypothetical protein AALP_AA8G359500 [Arabis alpina]|uniref:Hydroxyproline-rich glycoprotein family protein n=1 Tax=Arabis alpina TaxID=50452 RepID=A0A087GBL2_ARAAL|nr:hypothetical protein AALP_AA8G359500 [Arabis alpina]